MAKTLARRKYVKRVLVAMVGYGATLFLAEILIEDGTFDHVRRRAGSESDAEASVAQLRSAA